MNIALSPPDRLSPEDLAAWRSLLAADPRLDSPFLTPDWALAVARAQGGDASGVRVTHWTPAAGERAFFTARLRGRTAMPVGAPMCDYQALVARPGTRIEGRILLEGLGVDRLDFSHMLANQPSFAPYFRGPGPIAPGGSVGGPYGISGRTAGPDWPVQRPGQASTQSRSRAGATCGSKPILAPKQPLSS